MERQKERNMQPYIEGLGGIQNHDPSTQVYWIFGLCPLSGILKNAKEHNLLETGSRYSKKNTKEHNVF
jgi:hypothetical protein